MMSTIGDYDFPTTTVAFRECVYAMVRSRDWQELDLSSDNIRSYMSMRDLAQLFLEEYDRLSATMHTVAK